MDFREYGRSRALKVVGTVVAILLFFRFYLWLTARPDPRFTIGHLRGETPEQVVAEFGPPTVDPRLAKWGGWTPAKELELGPLRFGYDDNSSFMLYGYGIIFENGKVVDVTQGSK